MTIDFSIPRESIPWEGEGAPNACPKCGAPLQQERATYMILTQKNGRMTDSFMTGTDKGWFCTQCPVLLLDPQDFAVLISMGRSGGKTGDQFVIIGIVNLDAIPPEKEDLPIGGPGNPVPLVEFSNVKAARPPRTNAQRRSKSKRRKKRRR